MIKFIKIGSMVRVYPFEKPALVVGKKLVTRTKSKNLRNYWLWKYEIELDKMFEVIEVIFVNSKKKYEYPLDKKIVKKIHFCFFKKKRFINSLKNKANYEIVEMIKKI